VNGINDINYRSQIAYDSVQKELPATKRDDWFTKAIIRKVIIYKTKYKNDEKEAGVIMLERLMHTLPQALFISLPAFALILMLLYARRKFYYADHAIFTIHLYCAIFLLLLIYFGINKIQTAIGWGWLTIIKAILVLGMFFYLYKALRNFYRQGRGKTILKFVLLSIGFYIVVLMLFLAYIMLSVFQFS
jgi:hypothetical protein